MSLQTAKAIREERANLVHQMNDITCKVASEQRSMTPDEMQNFDNLDKAQGELLQQAESLERVERAQTLSAVDKVETRSFKENKSYKTDHITERDADLALRAFLGAGRADFKLTDEMRNAAHKVGFPTQQSTMQINGWTTKQLRAESRSAQSSVTGNLGQDTIFYEMMRPLEVALKAYGGLRNVADVFRTETGAPLPWPTSNDTSNVGRLLSENTQVTNTAIPFDTQTLGAYKYSSDSILIPIELLQDTHIDLMGYAGSALGERLGRIQSTHFSGSSNNGGTSPTGIFSKAVSGKTTALTTAITWQELVALVHSVDPRYRNNQGVGFCMHDTTWAYLKTLADSQNRPLWLPSVAAGAPDTFLGYPINIVMEYPAFVAGTSGSGSGNPNSAIKPITFGDHKKYKIRDVLGFDLHVLRERYMDYAQVGMVAFMRTDADLICNTGREPVKYLTIAT